MKRHVGLEAIPDETTREAIARTPLDLFVLWDGGGHRSRARSRCTRTLSLVQEIWTPVALRALILRAAQADRELRGYTIRNAVRQHQSAKPAAYLLVRRTPGGDYVAVVDIPWPADGRTRLRAGDIVLDRHGRRFPQPAHEAALRAAS